MTEVGRMEFKLQNHAVVLTHPSSHSSTISFTHVSTMCGEIRCKNEETGGFSDASDVGHSFIYSFMPPSISQLGQGSIYFPFGDNHHGMAWEGGG